MAITSSVVTIEGAQKDGRKWVHEVHSDAVGVAARVDYLGPSNVDTTAQAAADARAVALNVTLADAEVTTDLAANAPPVLRWNTIATLLANIRNRFKVATGATAAQIAQWIVNRLADASVTQAQLMTAFGANAIQWQNLQTAMTSLSTALTTVNTATGQ